MKLNSASDQNLLRDLKLCEENVWDALVTGDMAVDEAALDDAFLGVYADGFATKADHTQQLENGPTVESYKLSDHRAMPLGPEYAVLSYKAVFVRKTKPAPDVMYVSSIWRRQDSGWINVFSQDTLALD